MSHNPIRPWRNIDRRLSRKIRVGSVEVGGDAPIAVQSMTNTPTHDAAATIGQILRMEEAGVDIVRVSCPDQESTAALNEIVRNVGVPIVADIHFHYKRGIEAADAGAACLRINPGNIGSVARVREVVAAARANGCSMRIGVKASDMFLTVAAYQQLSEATDAPLHLGITEAGGLRTGTVKSSIGMGSLLWAGIGDTIRVSLSADPVEEVKVGYEMLKSLGLRTRGVNIIACPSCARQGFDVISTVETLEKRLAHISEPISLSIIGCVVNGPGEAAMTDLGFTGGGAESGMMYAAGKPDRKVGNAAMVEEIVQAVEEKARMLRQAREAASVAAE